MIERYTLPEMGAVWSEATKYELWCRVERTVLAAHAEAGTVPDWAVQPVLDAPPPTPGAVAEIEEVTQHDVIAFLTAWADNTSPREAAAYVHFGLTSSDLLDTALAVQLVEACDVLRRIQDQLLQLTLGKYPHHGDSRLGSIAMPRLATRTTSKTPSTSTCSPGVTCPRTMAFES